jgi:putative solute:sodium symporter small subunit
MPDLPDPTQRRARLLAARAAHWRSTRRVTALLLAIWLVTSFGAVWFARDLQNLTVFGWPLSFYMAAQGASLVYLAVIGVYAVLMRRADACYTQALEGPA